MQQEQYNREAGMILRNERIRHGMSQEVLGKHLGVTFQQIQKYERGINRICLSRVYQIAPLLGRDIWEKFSAIGAGSEVQEISNPRVCMDTFEAFQKLSTHDQHIVSNLIKSMAQREAA